MVSDHDGVIQLNEDTSGISQSDKQYIVYGFTAVYFI